MADDDPLDKYSGEIGLVQPASIMLETYCTGEVSNEVLTALVREHFDLCAERIVKGLNLLRPIFTKMAAYFYLGLDVPGISSEAIDKTATLKGVLL